MLGYGNAGLTKPTLFRPNYGPILSGPKKHAQVTNLFNTIYITLNLQKSQLLYGYYDSWIRYMFIATSGTLNRR